MARTAYLKDRQAHDATKLQDVAMKVDAGVRVELRQIYSPGRHSHHPNKATTYHNRQTLTLKTRPEQRNEVSPPSCRWRSGAGEVSPPHVLRQGQSITLHGRRTEEYSMNIKSPFMPTSFGLKIQKKYSRHKGVILLQELVKGQCLFTELRDKPTYCSDAVGN
jgi:hypothetical protein